MKLNPKIDDQKRWARAHARNRKKYGKHSTKFWLDLIEERGGLCALTCVPMLFDTKNGTPPCHPLYAAVDYKNPGRTNFGFQIICYDINDLKGHLPLNLFGALTKTKEWRLFVRSWKQAADRNSSRSVFHKLIKNGGK